MTYEEFNAFCKTLPGTSHVVQWGGAHVWKVGTKMFAIAGWDKGGLPAFTFKPEEGDYYYLQDQPGYQPAPYLASRGLKWIQIHDSTKVTKDDIKFHLRESHRIVSLGLTKKLQKELGLNQEA